MKKSTRIKGLSIFIILFVVINYLTINIVPAEQLELSESKTTGKINNIVVFLKMHIIINMMKLKKYLIKTMEIL